MDLPPNLEEETAVQRIWEQQAELAELDRNRRAYTISGPVRVSYGGEVIEVPLTVQDVRAALREEDAAEFDQEILTTGPGAAAAVIRKWALETIPGDELDRVDILLLAERQASVLGEAAT